MKKERQLDEIDVYTAKEVYEKEKVKIEERVKMLYAQSGGPEFASKRIEELMHQHLLYGKDHGRKGSIESYSDAVETLMTEDRSLSILQNTVSKWRFMIHSMFHMQNERVNRFLRAMEDHNKILENKLEALSLAVKEMSRSSIQNESDVNQDESK